MANEDIITLVEPTKKEVLSLPTLPEDVFLIIAQLLEPTQVVRCRLVSRAWRLAFTNPLALRLILKKWIPTAREVRHLDSWMRKRPSDFLQLFNRAAGRYHHLLLGKPHSVEFIPLYIGTERQYAPCSYPVATWEMHSSENDNRARPLCFQRPLWSYEDDMVVFLDRNSRKMLLKDLSTNRLLEVPFPLHGKVVRDIRVRQHVLAVEWAESRGSHPLNEEEVVHQHFATIFDIHIERFEPQDGICIERHFKAVFRNELKLHFFGLPLNKRDRFLANHDKKYYTIYFWQPNRSMYTGDEESPIESLAVWDISEPCLYRPSTDPSGHDKPCKRGPRRIMRLGFQELRFYDIRQGRLPRFTDIGADDTHVWISEITTIWIDEGTDSMRPALQTEGWMWSARFVGIPLGAQQGPAMIHNYPQRMSLAEALDVGAQVRHSVEQDNPWPAKLDPTAISLHTWVGQRHVKLDQSLLPEVFAKGTIAGDERYIIGENDRSELAVLRFDTDIYGW